MADVFKEKLEGSGRIKATMLKAHLDWAQERMGGRLIERLSSELDNGAREYLNHSLLATDWVPFAAAVEIDRTIARLVGGPLEDILRKMGRHSAEINLSGVYKIFVRDEPHRFFERMTNLHSRFQSFGEPVYEQTSAHSGRIRIEDCDQYSRVYCASALGYYEGALEMMKVPGPIWASEVRCQCRGDAFCLYELSW